MRVKVQRWGNSLAIRIPKPFAADAKVEEGALVDLSLEDGKLVVTPVTESKYTLDELLSGVTRENVQGEIDFGGPVGWELL